MTFSSEGAAGYVEGALPRRWFDRALAISAAMQECEIRRMLGEWVSEIEPTLIYQHGQLIGLGPPSEIGTQGLVTIRASADFLWLTRPC